MAKPKAIKTVARMSIEEPGKMSARCRKDIATWLRWQAAYLLKNGKNYTNGRFTAGLNYTR